MLMKMAARVRGVFAGNYPENREEEQIHINNRGDQIVTEGLPPLTEIVRLGGSFQVATSAAMAPLITEPTIVAGLSVWNGEPGGGKSYIIESVACWERVVDVTQQNQLALFAMNSIVPVTAFAGALTIRSLSGKIYGGRARAASGISVANDGWFPVGASVAGAAAVAGGAWRVHDAPLRGLYIVPPGGLFSVHAAKIAATAAQVHFCIRCHEAQIILG